MQKCFWLGLQPPVAPSATKRSFQRSDCNLLKRQWKLIIPTKIIKPEVLSQHHTAFTAGGEVSALVRIYTKSSEEQVPEPWTVSLAPEFRERRRRFPGLGTIYLPLSSDSFKTESSWDPSADRSPGARRPSPPDLGQGTLPDFREYRLTHNRLPGTPRTPPTTRWAIRRSTSGPRPQLIGSPAHLRSRPFRHPSSRNSPPLPPLRCPRELFTFVFAANLSELGAEGKWWRSGITPMSRPPRRVAAGKDAGAWRSPQGQRGELGETGPQRPPGPALTAPSSVGQRPLGRWAARSAPGGVGRDRRAAEAAPGSGSGVRAARASNERTLGRAAGRGLLALPPPPAPAEEEDGAERRPAPRRSVPRDPRSICIPALLWSGLGGQERGHVTWSRKPLPPGEAARRSWQRRWVVGGGLPRGWVTQWVGF